MWIGLVYRRVGGRGYLWVMGSERKLGFESCGLDLEWGARMVALFLALGLVQL